MNGESDIYKSSDSHNKSIYRDSPGYTLNRPSRSHRRARRRRMEVFVAGGLLFAIFALLAGMFLFFR